MIVAWSTVLYHVEWISSYHRCTWCSTPDQVTIIIAANKRVVVRHTANNESWLLLRLEVLLCSINLQYVLSSKSPSCGIYNMSQCMRFPTMWYVWPAKPQTSLRIRAVWSEPLQVAWIFYDCKATDRTPALKETTEARPSLHISKCHIIGNLMPRDLYRYEPRHGKMCLRGKFGHFEILWYSYRSLYEE